MRHPEAPLTDALYLRAVLPSGHVHASLYTAEPAVERSFRRTMRAQNLDVQS